MAVIKISEQIGFLRKQRGLTQEEVANALGVTNQAVSKWESAQCCPDVQLLPDIAELFEVTVDELLGYRAAEGLGDICLKIKNYFTELPEKEAFENAYRIAALLHEAAMTDGYKKRLMWKENKDYSTEQVEEWGMSLGAEPEGSTGRKNNCVFFALGKGKIAPAISELQNLSRSLERLNDPQVLRAMYSLYDLTAGEAGLYASCDEIADSAHLSMGEAEEALKKLPTAQKTEDGKTVYRLEDSFCYIPPLCAFLSL